MGIVGETNEIRVEFFRPAQDGLGLGFGMNAPATLGAFFMDGDAAQKNRLAVEQDLVTSDGDGPKANAVAHRVLARANFDVIQTRVFRGPTLGIRGDPNLRPARFTHRKCLLDTEFRNREYNFGATLKAHWLNPARNHRGVRSDFSGHANLPTAHIHIRHTYKGNLPSEPAVIVPVGGCCRDIVGGAPVVDPNHEQIFTGDQTVRHRKVEGRETAFVLAEQQTVQVDRSSIIGRAEMEKDVPLGRLGPIKGGLVPDRALIENQTRILGVPIAGDRQAKAVLKGKLRQVTGGLGLHGTRCKPSQATPVVGVDHRRPAAIQENSLPNTGVLNQRLGGPSRVLRHRAQVVDEFFLLTGPISEPEIKGQGKCAHPDQKQADARHRPEFPQAISPSEKRRPSQQGTKPAGSKPASPDKIFENSHSELKHFLGGLALHDVAGHIGNQGPGGEP